MYHDINKLSSLVSHKAWKAKRGLFYGSPVENQPLVQRKPFKQVKINEKPVILIQEIKL